jgi:hypothetical protein
MKFNRIVGFGDSWMWGDELLDPALHDHPRVHPVLVENTQYRESRCFLGLLGQHYSVPVENFGIAGGSLQSAIWCYLWWLNNSVDVENTLVLVGHTDAGRQSFYNPQHMTYSNDPPWNKFVHSSWVHSGNSSATSEWNNMVKSHMVLTDCVEFEKLNYQQAVLFFDGQAATRHGNLLQFCVARPPMVLAAPSLMWPDQAVGAFLSGNLHQKPHGHPNESGHVVIRDHLIKQIEDVILA